MAGLEADLSKSNNKKHSIFQRTLSTKNLEQKFIGLPPNKINNISRLMEKMKSSENQDNQYQLVFEILQLLLDKETLFNAYEEPQADLVAKWISIRALTRILSTASASLENNAPQIKAINDTLAKEDPNHIPNLEKNLAIARARAATKPGDLGAQVEYTYSLFMNGQARDCAQVAQLCQLLATSEYLLHKGIYYEYELHDSVTAKTYYKKALLASSNNTVCLTNLATIIYYKRKGTKLKTRVSEAIRLLKEAIKCDYRDENFLAHYHLAYLYDLEKKNTARALKYYFNALNININHMPSLMNCAAILMEVADAQNEPADRSEMLQKAYFLSKRLKKIDPQNLVAYYNMANISSKEGQVEYALKTIDEVIALFPHEPYSHMLKGNIYFNNEDYIEATKQYRKALSIHSSLEIGEKAANRPSIFDVNACKNNLIGALRRSGRILLVQGTKKSILDEAVNNLEEALHLCPQGVQSANLRFTLRLDLAFCFMKLGNLKAALENINTIMEDSPVLLLSTYAEREELFSNTISKIENCKPGEMGTEASYSYHYLQACQKAETETEPQNIANEHFNAAFLAFNLGLIFSCAKHLKEALKHSDHVSVSTFVTQQ